MARASRYDMAIECAFSVQYYPASAGFFLFYCSFFEIFLYLCVIERVYYEKVVGYFGALPCGNGLV